MGSGVEAYGALGRRKKHSSLEISSVRLFSGLLSNKGEKSINFYFIVVPLRKNYSSMLPQSPAFQPEDQKVADGLHVQSFLGFGFNQ